MKVLKILIYKDGDQFCAVVGPNLQDGFAGFGATERDALIDLGVYLGDGIEQEVDRLLDKYAIEE